MVISTITLNPAVDKTYYVSSFTPNALNRAWKTKTNIGGKGTNISAIACICGHESIASGFLAGSNGKYIEDTLNSLGVNTDFVYTEGETRINVKIVDIDAGSFTDVNDCGPPLRPSKISRSFLTRLPPLPKKAITFTSAAAFTPI